MRHHLIVQHVTLTLVPHPSLVVWALEVIGWHTSLHAVLLPLHVPVKGLLTPSRVHAILTPFVRHRPLRLRGVVFGVLRKADS